MEEEMEKIDYDLDPLDDSDHDDKNVLLSICDSSQGSQGMISNSEEIRYELRNSDNVLQYRFLNTPIINNNITSSLPPSSELSTTATLNGNRCDNSSTTTAILCNSSNSLPVAGCQVFVVNDVTPNRPCLISPKVDSSDKSEKRSIIIQSGKKRDEKRRATHNEVERRRRDKINQWIFKLRDLLPDGLDSDSKSKSSASEYSKGGILIRACEYIRSIKDENRILQKCLKESKELCTENTALKEELSKLRKENERLKTTLSASGKIDNDLDFETS